LPLISDDYLAVHLSRRYGPVDGWQSLASDALYRCRATSLLITHWLDQWWGPNAIAFRLSSLLIHILNTLLIYALGSWRLVGWRVAFCAAAFFAVYEGHQEAIVWFSALPELLVFLFGVLAFLAWLAWLRRPERIWLYAASLACFLLALFSKESAVVAGPLMLVPLWLDPRLDRRRALLGAIPFAVAGIFYTGLIFATRDAHLHFHDGTFSLAAPFWITLRNSFGRLFWFWGFLALLVLLRRRASRLRPLLVFAGAWMLLGFLPYSFLTYMPRVPSRHTYLASAGLAVVVAAGLLAWRRSQRPWAVATLAFVVVAHNCGYLWTVKRAQYAERAAPTEELLRVVARTDGPVLVQSFPLPAEVAELAVEIGAGKPRSILLFDANVAQLAQAIYRWEPREQTGRSLDLRRLLSWPRATPVAMPDPDRHCGRPARRLPGAAPRRLLANTADARAAGRLHCFLPRPIRRHDLQKQGLQHGRLDQGSPACMLSLSTSLGEADDD